MRRRSFVLGATSFALLGWTYASHAQETTGGADAQPLRIVVPYAAGGTGDMIARTLAEKVAVATGQTVLVDNKPGGGTLIGSQAVHAAPANGKTVLFVAASFVINPHLMNKMPFDPLKDFVPLTLMASNPHVLVVSNNVPVANWAEFVAWVKTRRGSSSFASFGNGSSGHLGFELLKKSAQLDMVHVPYKGAAPAMTDLLGGQVDTMLTDLPQAVESIKAGKIKALAIASDARSSLLPNVPTFAQVGQANFQSQSWYGLVMRSGTPTTQLNALNSAFVAALNDPSVRQKLTLAGLDVVGSTAAELGGHMKRESARYAEAVKLSGAQID